MISLTKKNKRTRRQNKRKRRIKQKNKRTKRKNKRKRTRIKKKKKQLQDKIKEEQKSKFAKELLSYVSSISMPANHIKYFVKKMLPTL